MRNAECGVRNGSREGRSRTQAVGIELALSNPHSAFRTSHLTHSAFRIYAAAPWHFLNFLPLPQGHGSLRPTPTYGLRANAGSATAGFVARRESGSPSLMRPSAAGLLATIGWGRRACCPPAAAAA